MPVSAEIRWFWPSQPPSRLEAWFCDPSDVFSHPPGGPEDRADVYLLDPGQVELGLKCRDAKEGAKDGVEVKGQVAVAEKDLAAGSLTGRIEVWTKWKSAALTFTALKAGSHGTVETKKRRWLRKFDTAGSSPTEVPLNAAMKPQGRALPDRGCNVELTRVALPSGDVWWTFGFESFGTLATVEADLRTVAALLADRLPPEFTTGQEASYPAWLQRLVAH
jgi:hypothetical protein